MNDVICMYTVRYQYQESQQVKNHSVERPFLAPSILFKSRLIDSFDSFIDLPKILKCKD
jgi:hypothetical protein